jgi:hypothetical protein
MNKKLSSFNSFRVNESHIDDDVLNEIQKLQSYIKLKEDFKKAIDEFTRDLDSRDVYDEGDNDHLMAYSAAIQEALDSLIGW